MSRGQQGHVVNVAKNENQFYDPLARSSFATTQGDIGQYAGAVGKFNAANPYVQGGEFETAQDQQLADTAAGGAESAGQLLQGQAVRTGQNAGGAIAATENMQEQNMRSLADEEAKATEQRIGSDVGYRTSGLGAVGNIEGMQNQLTEEEAKAAQDALNTEAGAAQTPSFMDTLGGSFASSLGKTLGGGNFQISKQV